MNSLTLYRACLRAIDDADQIKRERNWERRQHSLPGEIETATDELARLWQRRSRQRAAFNKSLMRQYRREDDKAVQQ